MNLPYTLLNKTLDDSLIKKWYKKFSETYYDTVYSRNNGGLNPGITELFMHELFIKNNPSAVQLKETQVNPYVKNLLKELNLKDCEFHAVFLKTNTGILDWHVDEKSILRPGCRGALMYSLNDHKRAPTEWIYNNKHYKLDGYKFSLINCECPHKVDNRFHEPRVTFRIALYSMHFEDLQKSVEKTPYAYINP